MSKSQDSMFFAYDRQKTTDSQIQIFALCQVILDFEQQCWLVKSYLPNKGPSALCFLRRGARSGSRSQGSVFFRPVHHERQPTLGSIL